MTCKHSDGVKFCQLCAEAELADLRALLERERVISGGLREDRDGIVKNWRACEKERDAVMLEVEKLRVWKDVADKLAEDYATELSKAKNAVLHLLSVGISNEPDMVEFVDACDAWRSLDEKQRDAVRLDVYCEAGVEAVPVARRLLRAAAR